MSHLVICEFPAPDYSREFPASVSWALVRCNVSTDRPLETTSTAPRIGPCGQRTLRPPRPRLDDDDYDLLMTDYTLSKILTSNDNNSATSILLLIQLIINVAGEGNPSFLPF